MAKKEYTCIAFFLDRQPAKYRGVTNVYNMWKYCQNKLSYNITHINIYDKRTKMFVKQIRSIHESYEFYKK